MLPLPETGREAVEIATSLALYRWVVSPVTAWGARRLGAGRYPATALNGTYPEQPPSVRAVLAVGAALAVLSVPLLLTASPRSGIAWLPTIGLGLVLWKHLTLDFDVALDLGWQRRDRVAALLLGGAALCFPCLGLAAVVLICGRLGGWTHHTNASLRVVKVSCCLGLAEFLLPLLGFPLPAQGGTVLSVLLGGTYLSHYVVAAWSKAKLGRRPWSWAIDNRTDLLVASAYAWGWGRFVPPRTAGRLISALRPLAPLLNTGTMVLESLGLVATANRWLFVAAIAGAICFNVVVALTSGLLFWENICSGAALLALTLTGPETRFGLWPAAFGLAVQLLVLAGALWHPNVLGWWDTPLAGRVRWTVTTVDGTDYGLYNDFMSPHDREYARSLGNALVPERIITFPLGGVEDETVRDGLLPRHSRLATDIAAVEALRATHGTVYLDAGYTDRHLDYLRRLLTAVNAGVPKSPLPGVLRRLKAPGGHLYYWGALARYRPGRGLVRRVSVRYREDLYDAAARRWVVLRDQPLHELDLTAAGPAQSA